MEIKICGITDIKETEYLNRNKVDYCGMVVFYEKSKRNVDVSLASKIRERLDKDIALVAVAVSPTLNQVITIENAGFDYIQIHGEIPDGIYEKTKLPILKAFNVKDLDRISEYEKQEGIKGYVFDAGVPGSGKTFDWDMLKDLPRTKKWILAGGLDASNVARAIKTVKPDGVDVSSAVENDNGIGKDPKKIDEFVVAVKHACEECD